MKTICGLLTCLLLISCTKPVPQVKQYTIDQFYKNLQINGGEFNADESKLLVTSDKSGIANVYELNIADTVMKPLTHSTVESFRGIDYVFGTQ